MYEPYLKDRCQARGCGIKIEKSEKNYEARGNFCAECNARITRNANNVERQRQNREFFEKVFKV